jgi:hypothetical protein
MRPKIDEALCAPSITPRSSGPSVWKAAPAYPDDRPPNRHALWHRRTLAVEHALQSVFETLGNHFELAHGQITFLELAIKHTLLDDVA